MALVIGVRQVWWQVSRDRSLDWYSCVGTGVLVYLSFHVVHSEASNILKPVNIEVHGHLAMFSNWPWMTHSHCTAEMNSSRILPHLLTAVRTAPPTH